MAQPGAPFFVPGTSSYRLPMVPLISNDEYFLSNWSSGHNPTQPRRSPRSRRSFDSRRRRPYTMAPAGGRGARPAPRRRGHRQGVCRHEGRPRAARSRRRHDQERHDHRGGRLHHHQGPDLLTIDEETGNAPDPRRRHVVRPGGGAQPGGRAAADAEVRRVAGRLRQPRHQGRLPGQRRGLLRLGLRRGAGARLAHPRRLQELRRIFTDPLVRDPFIRVFIWTFVFAAPPSSSPSPSACSWRSRSTEALRCSGFTGPALIPFAIPAFLSSCLGRDAQRRLRAINNCFRDHFPGSSTRPGPRISSPRQPLAGVPLLVPGLHGRAPGDPGGSHRGRARGRRERRARCSGRSPCRCCWSRSLRC